MSGVTEEADGALGAGAECLAATGAGEKIAVGLRVPATQCPKAIHERTYRRVDRDHAFGLQFAEGDMNGPLASSGNTWQAQRRAAGETL